MSPAAYDDEYLYMRLEWDAQDPGPTMLYGGLMAIGVLVDPSPLAKEEFRLRKAFRCFSTSSIIKSSSRL